MTKIDWADEVWNPVTGCTKISDGCKNCYAESMAHRLAGRFGYPKKNPFQPTLHPDRLDHYMKKLKPRVVFVNSMGDLFHPDVPFEVILAVYVRMVSFFALQHTFLVLTKRAERMAEFIERMERGEFEYRVELSRENIWHGVSVENQASSDERIPFLLQVPGKRFLSIEPMLGPVDLKNIRQYNSAGRHIASYQCLEPITGLGGGNRGAIHAVILGGESGPKARPMHPDWVRSVRDQCQADDVPFFFKQWGEWGCHGRSYGFRVDTPGALVPMTTICSTDRKNIGGRSYHAIPAGAKAGEFSTNDVMRRCGKKKAGRSLDGRTHDELVW